MGDNEKRVRVADSIHGPGPPVQPPGRRCERCKAKLNMYNKDVLCGPCRRKTMPRVGRPLTGGEAKKAWGG